MTKDTVKMLRRDAFVIERASNIKLPCADPLIISLDGCLSNEFGKGLKKPFDTVFQHVMTKTLLHLCSTIPGVLLGYSYSDKIVLIIFQSHDDSDAITSGRAYDLQKIISLAASTATLSFNTNFAFAVEALKNNLPPNSKDVAEYAKRYSPAYLSRLETKCWRATFTAKAFSVPASKVGGFIKHCQVNSIIASAEAVAEALGFTGSEIREAAHITSPNTQWLFQTIKKNWNNYPSAYRLGIFAVKMDIEHQCGENNAHIDVSKQQWHVVENTPNVLDSFKELNKYLPEI